MEAMGVDATNPYLTVVDTSHPLDETKYWQERTR